MRLPGLNRRRFLTTSLTAVSAARLGLRLTHYVVALLLGSAGAATAQVDSLPLIGRIKPRAARDVSSSRWSVGGETLDRGFGVYANYKAHLGPLGAKSIRLQAGWARCEPRPGAYDWGWLDAIVDDARAQGVQPWLQLSYGNPVYPGGGDTGLGGGFPSSPDALAAWDRWVRAIVQHFGGRVHQWEIWNEPDLNDKGTATVEAYVELYLRTAAMIREVQPAGESQIYALALCYDLQYADRFLAVMTQRGRLDLVDAVTIHIVPGADDTRNIDELRAIIARTGRPILVRQGETGAPSRYQESFALKGMPWTETMQAKWDLRRMLAHHAKDVPFSLFTMIDLHYRRDGAVDMNYKGLLASRDDQSVDHVKSAYGAAQRVFGIFDDALERVANFVCTADTTRSLGGLRLRQQADRCAGGGAVVQGRQALRTRTRGRWWTSPSPGRASTSRSWWTCSPARFARCRGRRVVPASARSHLRLAGPDRREAGAADRRDGHVRRRCSGSRSSCSSCSVDVI